MRTLSNHEITKRIIRMVHDERNRQKAYKYQDKEKINGELIDAATAYADLLIDAATAYADLAKKQILGRNISDLDDLKKSPYGSGYVQSGGCDDGYPMDAIITKQPPEWPEGIVWYPRYPKSNLIRAAAMIIAELERMEKADREYIKPPNKRKSNRNDVYADIQYPSEGAYVTGAASPTRTITLGNNQMNTNITLPTGNYYVTNTPMYKVNNNGTLQAAGTFI